MGFAIKYVPDSTFYLYVCPAAQWCEYKTDRTRWLNLEGLPESIADGLNFFQACLEEKVIVVPGIFFDLNPSRRRDLFDSPCHHFVRFSYGPRMDVLRMGLEGIERVVTKYVSLSKVYIGQWLTSAQAQEGCGIIRNLVNDALQEGARTLRTTRSADKKPECEPSLPGGRCSEGYVGA